MSSNAQLLITIALRAILFLARAARQNREPTDEELDKARAWGKAGGDELDQAIAEAEAENDES